MMKKIMQKLNELTEQKIEKEIEAMIQYSNKSINVSLKSFDYETNNDSH